MQSRKLDATLEREILTGMITDRETVATVAAKWDGDGLFGNKWSNLIGGWCIQYFNRYGHPIRERIEHRFDAWADRHAKDEDTVGLIARYLDSLDEDYRRKPQNRAYLKDQAATHFQAVQLERLRDSLDACLQAGQLEDAVGMVEGYARVEMGATEGVDILRDKEAIRAAFEAKREPIVQYPDALGEFFDDHLERDGFIAFMGSEKRGKSFWLLDMAWRAMVQRRRVAVFEVGDMSQHQIIRRFMQRAARRPFKPCRVNIPKAIEHEPGTKWAEVTEWQEREWDKPLSWQAAYKAVQKVLKTKVRSKDQMLRLTCYPNSSINVAGIRSTLLSWARRGWTPDVLVVDYADILAPPVGMVESRDQINGTWKQLRALSQELHILVVTATQADAASYDAEVLNKKHFTEDKRKFAHVTGMVGINQNERNEKEQGLQRLNWIVLREGEFAVTRCVHVAGCPALSNVAMESCF